MPPLMTMMEPPESPIRESRSFSVIRPKGDVQPFKPQRRGSMGQTTTTSTSPPSFEKPRMMIMAATGALPLDTAPFSSNRSTTKLSSGFASDLLKYLDVNQHTAADPVKTVQAAVKLAQHQPDYVVPLRPAMKSSRSEGASLDYFPKEAWLGTRKIPSKASDPLSVSDHGPRRRTSSLNSLSSSGRRGVRKPNSENSLLSRSDSMNSIESAQDNPSSSGMTSSESVLAPFDRRLLKSCSSLVDCAAANSRISSMKKSKSSPSLASTGLSLNRSISSQRSKSRLIRRASKTTPLETIDEFRSACFAKQTSTSHLRRLRSTRSSNSISLSSHDGASSSSSSSSSSKNGGTKTSATKKMKRNKSAPSLLTDKFSYLV